MAYSYKTTKGKTFYLHQKKLSKYEFFEYVLSDSLDGKADVIWQPLDAVPEGYEIQENQDGSVELIKD
jgi:hypothetical protein